MLLEQLRTGANCYVSGQHFPPNATVPTVEPMVLTWKETASIVFASGWLTQGAMLKLGCLVAAEARRPEIRVVYMCLGLIGGRLGSLRTTAAQIAHAREHAGVVAFLEGFAFGPSLWLAYQCDFQFASRKTLFGWLGCYRESDGQQDLDVTAAMIEDLAALNPLVSRETLTRLDRSQINGEQAEAARIVPDRNWKQDVFTLSKIDRSKWPEVAR
jgi:hypothetical protein